ncbi:MAG: hypothetical protein FJ039_11245 [Chloroflexi bacterium]|nr:hypothetical protein [Chloroflexota bacterium]
MSIRRALFMTHATADVAATAALYLRMFDIAEGFRARLEPHRRESQVIRIGHFYVEVVPVQPAGGTVGEYIERYGGYFPSMCFTVEEVKALGRALKPHIKRVVAERANYLAVEIRGMHEMVWEFTDLAPEAVIRRLEPKAAERPGRNAVGIQGVGSFSLLVDDIREASAVITKAMGGRVTGNLNEGDYAETQQHKLGGLTLSLLHPKRGDQVLTAVLARQGASIHSFCLVVNDMESARKELLTRGVAVLKERVPRLTIHPRSAYGARILLSNPERD